VTTPKFFNEIQELPEYSKDFKKLSKKFKTLPEDIETFINVQLNSYHKLGADNGGIVRIAGLGIEYPHIHKARKFACKSLKGKGAQSGIRVIYAFYPNEDKIEFIEIYYKGDQENEDRGRILKYYSE
jgi:mRNA-degrading endonuclease RelE of RelBE toxin-antitoxin system